ESGDHLAEDRILAVPRRVRLERDEELTVGGFGILGVRIARVGNADGALLRERPLLRRLEHADRVSAAGGRAAAPALPLRHVARLRIAHLDQRSLHDAVKTLT